MRKVCQGPPLIYRVSLYVRYTNMSLSVYISAAFHEKKKVVRKVPKGTSEYQAAWIIESDAEEDDDEDEDEEDSDEVGFTFPQRFAGIGTGTRYNINNEWKQVSYLIWYNMDAKSQNPSKVGLSKLGFHFWVLSVFLFYFWVT